MQMEKGIERLFAMKNISGFSSTPDGRYFAVSASNTYREKGKDNRSFIEMYDVSEGKKILTLKDRKINYDRPSVSDDGLRIAFAWKKGSESGIGLGSTISSSGWSPELVKLSSKPQEILISSAGGVLFIMKDADDPQRVKEKEEGSDQYFFMDDDCYSSLYHYIPGMGISRITENLQVWDFHERAGKIVISASREKGESAWYNSRLFTLDLEGKGVKEIYDPKWRELSCPRISSSGNVSVLESICSDRGLTSGDVLLYSAKDGTVKNLTEGHKRTYTCLQFRGNEVVALWREENTTGISSYDGKWNDLWETQGTSVPGPSPSFSLYGKYFILPFTDPESPQEVYSFGLDGRKSLTDINHEIIGTKPHKTEFLRWKSKDGTEIYGYLISDKPESPLIVNVHGGPTSFSYPSIVDRSTIYVDEGFSVFLPNYRGSTGKGREYAEANIGDMGGMDFQDILSGIEYLKETGRVKTQDIFIKGGSYGGFMTMWAVTQTEVFRTGVALFGISNWVSFHGTSLAPAWDRAHYNEDPYRRNLYEKFSPLNYIDHMKVPLLIMQGIEDPVVPKSQAFEMYQAMKDKGKDVRLLLFPREGHGFSEKKHMEAEFTETLKWFRKCL